MSIHSPGRLAHNLNKHFEKLRQASSTKELLQSELYQRLLPAITEVLQSVVVENLSRDHAAHDEQNIRVTAWNVERGIKLDGIIDVLRSHPHISASDVFLLTELDHGMARSGNQSVARTIAEALSLNYVFTPSYINLSKGSGIEHDVDGSNTHSLHGNGIFSRHPLREPLSVDLPNSIDKMAGREKRIGSQRIPIATVEHPLGDLRVAAVHLDAHSSQLSRRNQLGCLLDRLDELNYCPTLLGGDWNTSTYNCSKSWYAILGFWRRAVMGVQHVMRNHYPYPDRWFERPLFRMLEGRGYAYQHFNVAGGCTLHYDVLNEAMNSNAGEWVPTWCYPWVTWSLRHSNGLCSFKLDWFTGRAINAVDNSATVIGDLKDATGPLSDHDAISVDVVPRDTKPTA